MQRVCIHPGAFVSESLNFAMGQRFCASWGGAGLSADYGRDILQKGMVTVRSTGTCIVQSGDEYLDCILLPRGAR